MDWMPASKADQGWRYLVYEPGVGVYIAEKDEEGMWWADGDAVSSDPRPPQHNPTHYTTMPAAP